MFTTHSMPMWMVILLLLLLTFIWVFAPLFQWAKCGWLCQTIWKCTYICISTLLNMRVHVAYICIYGKIPISKLIMHSSFNKHTSYFVWIWTMDKSTKRNLNDVLIYTHLSKLKMRKWKMIENVQMYSVNGRRCS